MPWPVPLPVTVIRASLYDAPTGPVRNVDLVVGEPAAKWLAGWPGPSWGTHEPVTTWTAGRPGV
jgi:hypothetical protein